MNTHWSTAFILTLFLTLAPNKANAEEIILGFFDMEPHIFIDRQSGQAGGVIPDFLHNHLAPAMGVKIKLMPMSLSRVLAEMKQGSIAGAVMFGYTTERAAAYQYPKHHFSKMQSAIAVSLEHPLKTVDNRDDLNSIEIAYIKDAIITPFVSTPTLNWRWLTGNNAWQRNLKMLHAGRVEAVYSPQKVNLIYAANMLGIHNKIRVIPLPEEAQRLYSLFSKHPKYRDLSERYDKAMQEIDGRTIYHQLMTNFLKP